MLCDEVVILNWFYTVGVVRKGLWRWIDGEHRSALSIILAKSILETILLLTHPITDRGRSMEGLLRDLEWVQ